AGQLVRTRTQRSAVEGERAGVRSDEPADDVEERRLAGAVGPDDAHHGAGRNVERDALERDQSAEADSYIAQCQAIASRRPTLEPALFRRGRRTAIHRCVTSPSTCHVEVGHRWRAN